MKVKILEDLLITNQIKNNEDTNNTLKYISNDDQETDQFNIQKSSINHFQ